MNLEQFFTENSKVAIAFSGGVDSAYLLYVAKKYGADVLAVYVKTQFQPEFEYQDAIKLSDQLSVNMKVIFTDALSNDDIIKNPVNRCYYCKRNIFSQILECASQNGYSLVVDGTNASDDAADRPGMVALKEMQVRSPLRECGITKAMVRAYSREAGLFTWDKPSYACLATRIKTDEIITNEKLKITENAEEFLKNLGFSDFRIRMIGNSGKIQIREEQFKLYYEKEKIILNELKKHYDQVFLDNEPRKVID